ncbi:MAG: P-loop NTPase [Chloroflexota bacterium]
MKQLVILSGKGGTGKTSVTAALAQLASSGEHPLRTVLADADVDAANLELLLAPVIQEKHTFIGGKTAIIDPQLCGQCGTCKSVCRFDAVIETDEGFHIDPIACEGCGACVYQCPAETIRMEPEVAGQWFKSGSKFGPLFHAALTPAQENSGKLVSLVKEQAKQHAIKDGADLTLVDGPPGIGCAVISAISGADLALIVSEPTAAGVHDMKRVLDIAKQFSVPVFVCINKADIYLEGADSIEAFCQQNGIEVIGRIPFDPAVTEAMVQGQTVINYNADAPASAALIGIWQEILKKINNHSKES